MPFGPGWRYPHVGGGGCPPAPIGPYAYADFVNGCYYIAGVEVPVGDWITENVTDWGTWSPTDAIIPGVGLTTGAGTPSQGTAAVLGPTIASQLEAGFSIVMNAHFDYPNFNLLEINPYTTPSFSTFWDYQFGSSGPGELVLEYDDSTLTMTQQNFPTSSVPADLLLGINTNHNDQTLVFDGESHVTIGGLRLRGAVTNDTSGGVMNALAIQLLNGGLNSSFIRTMAIWTPMLTPAALDAQVGNSAPSIPGGVYAYADFKNNIYQINGVTKTLSDWIGNSIHPATYVPTTVGNYYTAGYGLTDWNALDPYQSILPAIGHLDDFSLIIMLRSEQNVTSYSFLPDVPSPAVIDLDFSWQVSGGGPIITLSSTGTNMAASAETEDSLSVGGTVEMIGWTSKRASSLSSIAQGPSSLPLPVDNASNASPLSPYSTTQGTSPISAYAELLTLLEYGLVIEQMAFYTPSLTPTQMQAAVACGPALARAVILGTTESGVNYSSPGHAKPFEQAYQTQFWADSDVFNPNTPTRCIVPRGYSWARVVATPSIGSLTASTPLTCSIYKNGSSIYVRREATPSTIFNSFVLTPLIPVSEGDYFELFIDTGSDTSVNISPSCYLTMELYALPQPPGLASPENAEASLATPLTGKNATANYTIPFDTKNFDNGGWFSLGSPTKMVVPSGVTYCRVTATAVTENGNATDCQKLTIMKNGSASYSACPVETYEGSTGSRLQAATPIIPVTAGDYFESVLNMETDTSVDINAAALGVEAFLNVSDPFNGLYGCVAYKSADQTGANYTAETAVTFDSELYDLGNWHDNVTNPSRMTVPSILGIGRVHYIRVHACIYIGSISSNPVRIRFKINGNTGIAPGAENQVTQTTKFIYASSTIFNLVVGDYVECFLQVDTDTSISVLGGANFSWFAIEKIPQFDWNTNFV